MLSNILRCSSDEQLEVVFAGGTRMYKEMGTFDLLGMKVHVNERSLANVLSFQAVTNIPGVRITVDTAKKRRWWYTLV